MEERGPTPAAGYVTPSRARLLPWALANFGLFLLVTLVGAVVIAVLDAGSLGVGQGLFAAGFFIPILFPGWLLHLLILGFLPAAWPRSRARLVSVLTSPILLILPYVTEGLSVGPVNVVAFAYALVARLRQPRHGCRADRDGLMSTSERTGRGWGTHVVRWLVNVSILIGLALALSIIGRLVTGTGEEAVGDSAALIVFAWYLTALWFLPGALLYLVLLELIPSRRNGPSRRISALVLSPLVGGIFWFYIVPGSESPAVTVAFVLATVLIYGSIVRLRPTPLGTY